MLLQVLVDRENNRRSDELYSYMRVSVSGEIESERIS